MNSTKNAKENATKPRRSFWRFALVAIWLAFGLLTALLIPMIAFLFDAPGSTENPYLIEVAYGLLALPFTCFFGAALLFFGNSRWLRLMAVALPLLAVGAVIHGFAMIDHVCGGNLACPKR